MKKYITFTNNFLTPNVLTIIIRVLLMNKYQRK